MKRIKVWTKEPHKVNDEVANAVYTQGEWLTHCAVEDRSRIVFDIFTVRYKSKVYLLVVFNNTIKECIEL